MSDEQPKPPPTPAPDRPPPNGQHARPWRTEGLPKGQPANEPGKRRPPWTVWVGWLLAYLLLFGVFTLQDRLAGPQAVPYTEFKAQVGKGNVTEVFARG